MTVGDYRYLVATLLTVDGVADAVIEPDTTDGGLGVLRLRLADDADEAAVEREVSRLLLAKFQLAVDAGRMEMVGEHASALGRPLAQIRSVPAPTSDDDDTWRRPADPDLSVMGPDDAAPESQLSPGEAVPAPSGQGFREPLLSASWESSPQPPPRSAPQPPSEELAPQPPPEELAPQPQTEELAPQPAPQPLQRSRRSYELPVTSPQPSRLSIEHVQMVSKGLGVSATVGLAVDDQLFSGEAEGASTASGIHRCIAAATLRAVEAAIAGRARFEPDYVELAATGGEQTALTVVTMVTPRGSERLSGASVVREDDRHAVIRSVLAAVNRRLVPLLEPV